jgi:hypothetical protein
LPLRTGVQQMLAREHADLRPLRVHSVVPVHIGHNSTTHSEVRA